MMRKIAGFLIAITILFLAACSQPEATSQASEPTAAPSATPEAQAEPTDVPTAEPTQAPTDAPEPTEVPPTPTEEPPAEDGPFISSAVNLDDFADRMSLGEMLAPDQASLAAITGEDILQFAVDVNATGLFIALIDFGPFTVFAPTFKFEDISSLTFPNAIEYRDALRAHIVNGLYLESDLLAMDGQSIPTLLDGVSITVSVQDGVVYLNDSALIIDADIFGNNGVIQVIDQFLIPAAQ